VITLRENLKHLRKNQSCLIAGRRKSVFPDSYGSGRIPIGF